MKVALILTGGTASCSLEDTTVSLSSEDPCLEIGRRQASRLGLELEAYQPFRILSEDARPQHWLELAAAIRSSSRSAQAVVVVHGTDTLAYSAGAAALLTRDLRVPVIFTGAMLAAEDPNSDLYANLWQSLTWSQKLRRGCFVAFDGLLHQACRVRKDLSRPESYVSVASRALTASEMPREPEVETLAGAESLDFDDRVMQLRLYPGIPLESLFAACAKMSGVVIELYASGTAPSESPDFSLPEWITALRGQGTAVGLTRPWSGLSYDYPAWPRLMASGAIDLADTSTEFATVKLMWALAQRADTALLMQSSLCGELDTSRLLKRSKLESFSSQSAS